MTNNVYCLYNKLSARYGEVMAYPSDGFAVARINELVSRGGFNAEEVELCRCGSIDIESGCINSTAPVRVPLKVPTVDDLASESK